VENPGAKDDPDLNILKESPNSYDVTIAGGGIAGVAAALEAARNGMKTALIEKTVFTGGLATTGLINIYLPLCDGRGRQVIFGIAEELLKASILYGPGDVPAPWLEDGQEARRSDIRYATEFNPASFTLALDELLQKAGVDIWLDTLVCGVRKKGNRVTGLEVETKNGRQLIDMSCVIDATGDADVAWRAGAPCAETDNFLEMWAIPASLSAARKAVEAQSGEPLVTTLRVGVWDGSPNLEDYPKLRGTDVRDITKMVLDGRRLIREYYHARNSADGPKSRWNQFPIALPAMAQFRTTRRIEGKVTLTDEHETSTFADSLGICGDWRKPGPIWEIPYGCLLPREIIGLLTAGRCIASDGNAWEATRVIPVAALTGQIAGLAASMAVSQSITPDLLDVRQLQEELTSRGMPVRR